jgi:hypothetical protein
MLGHLLKTLIALALLPLVAGEVWTLIDLAQAAIPAGEWHSAWFASLAAGGAIWILIFNLLPRTLWLYVLGHEFTHALAAMLAGGKVSAFKVSSKGGHVLTDRVNWWIALSPYFVPIYALIWIALWLTVDFYYPLKAWQPVLYFGIGLFWAFHLTFTYSILHSHQTDLSREGYPFSIVVILLFNLLFFLLLLSLLTHDFARSWTTFVHRSGHCYILAGHAILHGATWAQQAWHNRNS